MIGSGLSGSREGTARNMTEHSVVMALHDILTVVVGT